MEHFRNASRASINIVVSNHADIESARQFESIHQISYLVTPFPIGAIAGEAFLKAVGSTLRLDPFRIEQVIMVRKGILLIY